MEWLDPIARFADVFARAQLKELTDPTPVAVATATPDGRPSVRIVLLRGFDERGFVFFTNSESRKGGELLSNPRAALCMYYPVLGEQVRVEGTVESTSEEESDAYFATRPVLSQIGAWASEQSRPLDSREALIERCEQVKERFKDGPVARPPHWYGFRVVPERIEFWINGEFRLHDRYEYTRVPEDSTWRITRLNP